MLTTAHISHSPHLDIEVHPRDQYLEHQAVISIQDICCHCARMSTELDGKSVWLTIGIERVSL